MNVKLLSIGMFVFGMDTLAFDEFSEDFEARFARNARVGARDAAQFVGINSEISLQGTAYAELSDGRASIDTLKEMARSGKAWPVVDGTGRVFGNFHLTRIRARGSTIMEGGVPLRIDFSVDMFQVDDATVG